MALTGLTAVSAAVDLLKVLLDGRKSKAERITTIAVCLRLLLHLLSINELRRVAIRQQ